MAQRDGEIGIGQAADMLELSEDTVRRWAKRAHRRLPDAPFVQVRRDIAGRYWLSRHEVLQLLRKAEEQY